MHRTGIIVRDTESERETPSERYWEKHRNNEREWANPYEGVAIHFHIGETSTTATVAYYFSIASHQWVVKINSYIHKLDSVDYDICGSTFLLEQLKDNVHTGKDSTFFFFFLNTSWIDTKL